MLSAHAAYCPIPPVLGRNHRGTAEEGRGVGVRPLHDGFTYSIHAAASVLA